MKTTEDTQQAKKALEASVKDLINQFIQDNPGFDVSITASCIYEDWGQGKNVLIGVNADARLTLLPALN